jgi:hypothetical protein
VIEKVSEKGPGRRKRKKEVLIERNIDIEKVINTHILITVIG